MSRQIIQDVIPTREKDIRRIPIPQRKESTPREAIREVREEFETPNEPKKNYKKRIIIISIIVVIVLVLVLITTVFARATVTVTPATQSASVSASLTAGDSSTTTSNIDFKPITLTQKETVTVTGTGTKQVDTKATGTIIVFNGYSTAPQKLIANTRFETTAGLIYRIDKSITVPGETTKAGVTTPGSIEATVTADQSGANYNIALSDFTIPGFAGEPQFKGFFARSETVMSGGFSGVVPIISDTDRANAISTITSDLTSKLAQAVSKSVPTGYILYPNGYHIVVQTIPDVQSGTNQTIIGEQATLTGFALNEVKLDSALATSAGLNGYNGEPISIKNESALTFSVATSSFATIPQILPFKISGQAQFVWTTDAAAFAKALAGQSRSSFATILQSYPHILKADVSFFPLWLIHFPKASKIHINIAQ